MPKLTPAPPSATIPRTAQRAVARLLQPFIPRHWILLISRFQGIWQYAGSDAGRRRLRSPTTDPMIGCAGAFPLCRAGPSEARFAWNVRPSGHVREDWPPAKC